MAAQPRHIEPVDTGSNYFKFSSSLKWAASDRHIMKRWRWPFITVVLLSLFAAFSRSSDAGPDPTAEQPFVSRTEVRQQDAVTVRAAVLTDDESERYFGASLADHGIQVVWLSVDNASDSRLRFLPIVTDPNYFSAPEVERLLHAWWRGSTNESIASVVAQSPMPDVIPPGARPALLAKIALVDAPDEFGRLIPGGWLFSWRTRPRSGSGDEAAPQTATLRDLGSPPPRPS